MGKAEDTEQTVCVCVCAECVAVCEADLCQQV